MTSVAYSMFNGFNRGSETKTMMGNWQEEKALKDLTGFTRAPDKQSQRSGNHHRVIHHTEQELSKDYNSTYRNQFKDCSAGMGQNSYAPRKAKDYAKIKQIVKDARDEIEKNKILEMKKTYYTTNTRDQMKYDALKNQEQYKYVKFQKNTALTKPRTEKRPIVFPKQSWADLYRGEAITSYSLAARRGNDSGVNFQMSCANGSNPFGRSSRYTNNEPFKKHSEGSDNKGMKPSGPGMLMHDRNALEEVRVNLIGVCKRVGSKNDIINFLKRSNDGTFKRYVTFDELKAKLSDLEVNIIPREAVAIKRSFDYGGYDEIDPEDLISILC